MSLPEIKVGDRVRITVEGVVKEVGPWRIFVRLDGSEPDYMVTFNHAELTAPTARVEVLGPPIDPDLVLAREWFKAECPRHASGIDAGRWDYSEAISSYLAGLKAAKGGRS